MTKAIYLKYLLNFIKRSKILWKVNIHSQFDNSVYFIFINKIYFAYESQ